MKKRGFTLIELLVVIAIIGLLSSVVLVYFKGTRERAIIAKGLEFSQSINSALGANAMGIWRFDETSGSAAIDSSGNGNTGTINGATRIPAGMMGGALSFDGNDFVAVNHSKSLEPAQFTIELWAYLDTVPSNTPVFLEKTIYPGSGYYYAIETPSGKVDFGWASNSGWLGSNSGYVFPVARWTHAAVTFDAGSVKHFINGVLVKSTQGGGGIKYSGTKKLYIGSDDGTDRFFSGKLDEVRIYSQVLSANEIKKHYAEGLKLHDNLASR